MAAAMAAQLVDLSADCLVVASVERWGVHLAEH